MRRLILPDRVALRSEDSDMLEVWGRRSAYNVQKVMWALGEVGVAHEHHPVGGSAGGLDAPEFLAMNPHGRIPVVVDGNATIWESNSVVRYLAATYGPRTLWPADPAERSLADRWMDWELATLQPAFMNLFWSFYRTPEVKRDPQRVERARELCGYLYGLLDAELARRPFLAGDAFTMGDVPVATSLFRYLEMGIDVPALPNVRAWYERLAERPAYREHIMIPFEELRGKMTV